MHYQHGGDILTFAQQNNCHPSEVIDLSSNINFVQPNISLDFNTLNISSYPNYDALYRAIAKLYAVSSSNIELFNGATSAISSLFRMLDLKNCTLYAPCYLEYEKVAKLQQMRLHQINRFEDRFETVPKDSLVIFVNPSTPDGKFYELDKLMKHWKEQNCTVIIDESFLDFTPFESATKYLESYDKLYILKSMTKFYSSAGIRIGAVLSQKKNIIKLKVKEPLWKISEFDSCYLQSALKDPYFLESSSHKNSTSKEYLISIFQNFKYTEHIYDSSSNFILVQLQKLTAKALQEALSSTNIMIRDCSNFHFLDKTFVRIAVKSVLKLKILEKALLNIK